MELYNWNEEEIKRFWDYESQFTERYFSFQVKRQLVLHFEEYIKDKDILDYGAGAGFFLEGVLEDNKMASVTAIEDSVKSAYAIDEKLKRFSKYKGAYITDEISTIQNKFDSIFCFEVIEHLNDVQLKNLLNNITDLLKDNGYIIITTPNDEILSNNVVYCPCCNKAFHRWGHVRSWNKESIDKMANDNNFIVKYCYGTDLRKYTDEYYANGGEKNIELLSKHENGQNLIVILKKKGNIDG